MITNLDKFLLMVAFITAGLPSCNNRHSEKIAVIEYNMSGCFASENSRLFLFKRDSNTIARLETGSQNHFEAQLNNDQVKQFYVFITNLKTLKDNFGCTFEELYKVTIQEEIIYKRDGSCAWHGFDQLKMTLFNSK